MAVVGSDDRRTCPARTRSRPPAASNASPSIRSTRSMTGSAAMRTDLVAAIVVVGEVRDGEVGQRPRRPAGPRAARRSRHRPCRSGGAGRPCPPSFCAVGRRAPTKSPRHSIDGPSTVSVSGTPGSAAISPGMSDAVRDVAAEDEVVEAGRACGPRARPSRTASAPAAGRRSAGAGSRGRTRRSPRAR